MLASPAYIAGMERAARIADANKRGESSRQASAIRREIVTMKLRQEVRPTLRSRFLGCVALAAFGAVFTLLLARGVIIESDWQHTNFCRVHRATDCE